MTSLTDLLPMSEMIGRTVPSDGICVEQTFDVLAQHAYELYPEPYRTFDDHPMIHSIYMSLFDGMYEAIVEDRSAHAKISRLQVDTVDQLSTSPVSVPASAVDEMVREFVAQVQINRHKRQQGTV